MRKIKEFLGRYKRSAQIWICTGVGFALLAIIFLIVMAVVLFV